MENAPPRQLTRFPVLVCLGCTTLPFMAIHGAFLISAAYGFVDSCNPYWDSCTSICATGRRAPASYLFRGIMLPMAMLSIVYWWLHWKLLELPPFQPDQDRGKAARRRHSMLLCGIFAGLGLALYVTVLGEIGDVWRTQRKVGAVLFFSLTFLAQLLLAAGLRGGSAAELPRSGPIARRLLRICQLMLLIGIFCVALQLFDEALHDSVEDAIEWQLALLLQLNFMFSVALWWRGRWSLALSERPGS